MATGNWVAKELSSGKYRARTERDRTKYSRKHRKEVRDRKRLSAWE